MLQVLTVTNTRKKKALIISRSVIWLKSNETAPCTCQNRDYGTFPWRSLFFFFLCVLSFSRALYIVFLRGAGSAISGLAKKIMVCHGNVSDSLFWQLVRFSFAWMDSFRKGKRSSQKLTNHAKAKRPPFERLSSNKCRRLSPWSLESTVTSNPRGGEKDIVMQAC